MSVFGAMTTGVSGLKGFGGALNHISENISNVTTLGYKRVETRFSTLVTTSTSRVHNAGGANIKPSFRISSQGLQQQSDVSTHLSVTGEGMFTVTDQLPVSAITSYGRNSFYTRAGDFIVDQDGYLKNGAGYYLQGWTTDSSGDVINTSQLAPLRVTDIVDAPMQTTTIDYNVNVPSGAPQPAAADLAAAANPAAITGDSTHPSYDSVFGPNQILVYDSLGGEHSMTLDWTKVPAANAVGAGSAFGNNANPNKWLVSMTPTTSLAGATITTRFTTEASGVPADLAQREIGVEFAADGSIVGMWKNEDANVYGAGGWGSMIALPSAAVELDLTYGGTYLPTSPQTITIDFGTLNATSGSTTQWNEPDISIRNFLQDGNPAGAVENIDIDGEGLINLNFDNGNSTPRYKIPIARFANYNGLQLIDGNAYLATSFSGDAFYAAAGDNGLGTITSNNLELSNVDLADEFTKMIVVQRAYSGNARVVTIAAQLLEEVTAITR